MDQPSESPSAELSRLVERHGIDLVKKAIKKLEKSPRRELTVIVNSGMHSIPEDVIRGDVFVFSEGQVDLTGDGIDRVLDALIKRAHSFLSGGNWNKVYIIPSGHPLLVVVATLVTFRSTRIDPVIVAYLGSENYVDFDSNIRERIFSKEK